MGILKLFASDSQSSQATPIHYDEAATQRYRQLITQRLAAQEDTQEQRSQELRRRVEQRRAEGLPIRTRDLAAYLSRQTRLETRQEADFA